MTVFTELLDQIFKMSIVELRLSTRVHHALVRSQIKTIGSLVTLSMSDTLALKWIGETGYNEIIEALDALNARFGVADPIDWVEYVRQQNTPSNSQVVEVVESGDTTTLPSSVQEIELCYLYLPQRIYMSLIHSNIATIGELLFATKNNLYWLQKKFGVSTVMVEKSLIALSKSINANDEVNWIDYYNHYQISLIPQNYIATDSYVQHLEQVPEVIRQVFENNNRDWKIIQRRFELDGKPKLTLEQLGEGFGLTRERIRQIENKSLNKLRNVLFGDHYIENSSRVHPTILSTFKLMFSHLNNRNEEFILENTLFESMSQLLGTDVSDFRSTMIILFKIIGMSRIEFNDPDLVAVWEYKKSDQREILEHIVTQLDSLLTHDIAISMEEFDVLLRVNKELPKGKRITLDQLRSFIPLCSTVEQCGNGLFRGKFEYIKSRGNQVERLLTEADKTVSIIELTRSINSKLVVQGQGKLIARNLANQLVRDERFVSIGRSGWALKVWNHIDTSSIIKLMEQCLHERNEPVTSEEIFEYVISRRRVSKGSISSYLAMKPQIFCKADRTRWGLASWSETQNAVTWNPEQVAVFVADFFKKHKKTELEFKIVSAALKEAAGVSSRQAAGWLNVNPVIVTRKGPKSTDRFAVFQPSYKRELLAVGARFRRKNPTKRQQLEEIVCKRLEATRSHQLPLAKLIEMLTSKHGFYDKTAYRYIGQSEIVETLTVPGTKIKICRLKDKQGLSFPQISNITDMNMRESIEKAILDLNEDDIDLGLFQLGREFEAIIKKSLLYGEAKKKITFGTTLGKDPTKWKLIQMVDCAKSNELITDLGVVNLLRQERNNRAHGSRPSIAERRALMNAAQYIAGMYIDYIIIFEDFLNSLT